MLIWLCAETQTIQGVCGLIFRTVGPFANYRKCNVQTAFLLMETKSSLQNKMPAIRQAFI